MISLIPSSLARSCAIAAPKVVTKRSVTSTIRLIALQDLPHGKAYKGDVVNVKAGYARNFLIPKKLATYATPQNFEKYEIVDPNFESEEERKARLLLESSMSEKDERSLRESDLLKKYLRTKVVSGSYSYMVGSCFIWCPFYRVVLVLSTQPVILIFGLSSQLKISRVVDPNSVDALHPGYVTAHNIREKLSNQLQIDLDPQEPVHIISEAPIEFGELDDDKIQSMVDEFEPEDGNCQIKIRRLGTYLANIGLEGGYSVPLKCVVQQRVP
jgi:hypothetical protein